jgi:type I restriction enzyme, S subunit
MGRFWVNNHANVLRARPITSNEWLCLFMNMIDLTLFVTGSAQPKLTQAALNRIHVPIPSPDEQAQIIARVEAAFAWISKIASKYDGATRLIERLDQSILVKAFRGELVPQEPNEPASVLLERIRAKRVKHLQRKERTPNADYRRGAKSKSQEPWVV